MKTNCIAFSLFLIACSVLLGVDGVGERDFSFASESATDSDSIGQAYVDIIFTGGQSNAVSAWAEGIESVLRSSGAFPNLRMVHLNHPGSWMLNWYTDQPRGNFESDFYNASGTGALELAWKEVLEAGKEPRLAGFFWFQGEGDTGSYSDQAVYVGRFQQMLSLLQTHFEQPNPVPFAVAIIDANQDPIYDAELLSIGRTREMVESMRAELWELGAKENGVAVDTRDAERRDVWHLTGSEARRIGEEMARAFSGADITTIETAGKSFDLAMAATWAGGSVPGVSDIADFVHPGTYTASSGSDFHWYGILSSVDGSLEINPGSGGNSFSLHLGEGGIAGTQDIDRLGANLTIDVGTNDQVWRVPLGNVQAVIAGSARVTYTGNARMWLRGNNTFNGTWRIDGPNSGIHPDTRFSWSSSLGAKAELLNDGYLRLSNTSYDRIDGIDLVGNGRLLVSGNASDNGAIASLQASSASPDSGDIYGVGELTVSSNLNYGYLQFQADIYHEGDTVIADKSAGMTLDLTSTSTYTFALGADGVNNQIRGLSATQSKLVANGTFVFDLSHADPTEGNSWKVVDVDSLEETFGPTFRVDGFFAEEDGLRWTLVKDGHTWTFDESIGSLDVTNGGTPPVVPPHDVFFMGGQSNAKVDIAAGIEDVLRLSGQFDNPTVVWNRHSGQAISRWFEGNAREFYDEDLFGQAGAYDQDGKPQGLLESEIWSEGGPHPFRGFFWWQGEADASASESYAPKFLGMLNQLASDLGQSMGTDSSGWTCHIALPDDLARSYEAIRDAQIAMVEENASVATYFDTRPYPRLSPTDNPHVPQDLDYFIGVDMANQYLAFHGLPTVDLRATENTILVKSNVDVYSQEIPGQFEDIVMLNRANAWIPQGIPGMTNTLLFDASLGGSRIYYLGGSSYHPGSAANLGGPFAIGGVDYRSPYQTTIERFPYTHYNVLSIGAGGVDAGSATSRLIINVDVETPVSQTWTVASGQSILFNSPTAMVDLRNAHLTGGGTFDLRRGTVSLGSQPNTALMSFYIGGPDLIFSAASDAGLPSPLGTGGTLRSGAGSDTSFTYDGANDAAWNRNIVFDTIPEGRRATFGISRSGVTFTSSGIFGVYDEADVLNLRLGGAGNLVIAGNGGVRTKGSAICNLEKFGAGTLTLVGEGNTFNGDLVISAGGLTVQGAASVNTARSIEVGSVSSPAVFEYYSSVALDRDVTVFAGSTFRYVSDAPYSGSLTVHPGAIVILDGTFALDSLEIPAGALFVLRGDAALQPGMLLRNSGVVDILSWEGSLPPNFINDGFVREKFSLTVVASEFTVDAVDLTFFGFPGHLYQLEESSDLEESNWASVASPFEGSDSLIIHTESVSADAPRFFRLTVDP